MLSGNYSEAVEYLELAVRLQPDHEDFHNNVGIALSHTGRLPEAIEHFRQALELKPDYPDAHYDLALALFSMKQIDEAIPHLQQVIDDPKYIRAYAALVRALVAKNRTEEAVATAQKGLAIARAAGRSAEAAELEALLKHYQAERGDRSKATSTPAPQSSSVSPNQ
jgi:tetratricopeptide (TPR) repeat protein